MSTLTIVRLPTEYAGRFHPAVRELARRVRPQAVGLSAGGHVRRAAALARAHGRYEDRHLVHLNDLELAELARAWGPPHTNPHTGLPEYSSFFSDIGDAIGSLFGASGIGGVVGDIASLANTGLGIWGATQAPTQTAYEPGGSNTPSMYSPSVLGSNPGTVGQQPVGLGMNLNDLLGIGSSVLGFVGALNRNRAQQKAVKQSQKAYQDYLGPHVDYHMGSNPTTVTGLAPSGPSELAGFRPEDTLTQSNTPPMATGGQPPDPRLGALDRLAPAPRPPIPPYVGALRSGQFTPPMTRPPMAPYVGVLRDAGMIGPPRTPLPFAAGQFPRGYAGAGQVGGEGGGQDDRVPAYLSQDEYVIPADVVSHLGDGSSNEGARRLDGLVSRVRETRTGNDRFPPRVGALNGPVGHRLLPREGER